MNPAAVEIDGGNVECKQLADCDGLAVETLHRRVLAEHLQRRANGADEEIGALETEFLELIETITDPIVQLAHRKLPPGMADFHSLGWNHYLARLAIAGEGGDPGKDPWSAAV